MNDWEPGEWDRGYEAGRKAGLEEAHRYQHQCNADLETRAKLRQEGRDLERDRLLDLAYDELDKCECEDALNHLIEQMKEDAK